MNKHCFRPFSCLRPLQLRKQTNLYLILGPFFIILISYATLSRPAPAYVCVSFFFFFALRACVPRAIPDAKLPFASWTASDDVTLTRREFPTFFGTTLLFCACIRPHRRRRPAIFGTSSLSRRNVLLSSD